MRRLLSSLAVTLVVLGFIALFGGVHYYSYSKFTPSSAMLPVPKDGFRPDIYPVFSQGSSVGLKCIIPFLYYREWTSDRAPMVVVSTHDTFDHYGYAKKSGIVLETLTVKNELGETFQLVAAQTPEVLSLAGLGTGSGTACLGAVNGKKITISAKGYAITESGEHEAFTFEQTWTESHSSRIGLAISFSE